MRARGGSVGQDARLRPRLPHGRAGLADAQAPAAPRPRRGTSAAGRRSAARSGQLSGHGCSERVGPGKTCDLWGALIAAWNAVGAAASLPRAMPD
eukprot:5911568-Pyramimonas_sp.AAC.2